MEDSYPTHASFLEGQRLIRRAMNPPIRAVLEHWLGLHDKAQLPAREHLDPVDLPRTVFPYLFLLDRRVEGPWRVRLMGSHVVNALGHDFTGCDLVDEQIPRIAQSRTARMLPSILETGLPAHFHGRSEFRFLVYDDHEQILLPLRHLDGATVDVVLGAIVYEGLDEPYGPGSAW